MNKENEFITILGEPEWNKNVRTILDKYDMPKPDTDSFIAFSDTEDNFIGFTFDSNNETDKQKDMKEQGNLYLQSMGFEHLDSKRINEIPLPFGIRKGTSYYDLVAKIGHADLQSPNIVFRKMWHLKKENGEIYNLVCVFTEDLKNCRMLYLLTFNSEREYKLIKNETGT